MRDRSASPPREKNLPAANNVNDPPQFIYNVAFWNPQAAPPNRPAQPPLVPEVMADVPPPPPPPQIEDAPQQQPMDVLRRERAADDNVVQAAVDGVVSHSHWKLRVTS